MNTTGVNLTAVRNLSPFVVANDIFRKRMCLNFTFYVQARC